MLLTLASRYRVMRSPRLAAMGVATLSGLIPTFLDPIITATTTRPGQDRVTTDSRFTALSSLRFCPCAFLADLRSMQRWKLWWHCWHTGWQPVWYPLSPWSGYQEWLLRLLPGSPQWWLEPADKRAMFYLTMMTERWILNIISARLTKVVAELYLNESQVADYHPQLLLTLIHLPCVCLWV